MLPATHVRFGKVSWQGVGMFYGTGSLTVTEEADLKRFKTVLDKNDQNCPDDTFQSVFVDSIDGQNLELGQGQYTLETGDEIVLLAQMIQEAEGLAPEDTAEMVTQKLKNSGTGFMDTIQTLAGLLK
jgi:hypothetical protein